MHLHASHQRAFANSHRRDHTTLNTVHSPPLTIQLIHLAHAADDGGLHLDHGSIHTPRFVLIS